MNRFSDFLPSDEWQFPPRVHWHGYHDTRPYDGSVPTGERVVRLAREPDAVLCDPWAVASWLDEKTRAHVLHAESFAFQNRMWVSIGDEDDLQHLREEHALIASRGDSIYTDIYTPDENERHDLYVEAVTDDQCARGCTGTQPMISATPNEAACELSTFTKEAFGALERNAAVAIGAELQRVRKRAGLTRKEVVAQLGNPFSETALARYEYGSRALTSARLVCLCRFFGVVPADVCDSALPRRTSVEG
ncbi:helix-turn-helix protein [Herbihabitans rhizosphaerae]|uniref:Helix-turn-helix protein n=1 Tax=Herbihabitans rhizosphaerae TaxID=1872711 RepID=A0A4Q7KGW4_9PSEU|nr:helix-turn-helix transcriptional regulator [Herbihabitans rhizosphaerae]RZS32487.1 helix-turn-helix protein [Herbihabitans rhizosphaerae]